MEGDCTYPIYQDEEEDGGADSELDESESEGDVAEEENQRSTKEENKETKSAAANQHDAIPVMAPAGLKGQQKTKANSAEEVLRMYDSLSAPEYKLHQLSFKRKTFLYIYSIGHT